MNKHSKKGITLNLQTAAYLAGLFEGEASFTTTTSGHPRIQLGMTDKDVIERVAQIFNVRVYERSDNRPNCKTIYQLAICKAQVVCDTLQQLLPFMSIRRSNKFIELLEILKDKGIEPTSVLVSSYI